MKRFVLAIFLMSFLIMFPGRLALAENNLAITAESAILIDVHTGQVLYEKNAYSLRPPASTTKIATALVALEMGDLGEMVTVSQKAANVGESSMHLVAGEKLSLEQLLNGALIRSGNDACVAIAEHLGGSEDAFVRLVNNRLNFLGAKSTNFVNTNGLPATGHATSAYDLALVTRYALLNPTFCKIVGTRYAEVHGPDHWSHSLTNTNKLLWKYPGTIGVKTGTTNEAGQCLVASATRDGKCLITVVLHSTDRYEDSIKLLEYGFNNFQMYTVIEEGEVLKKIELTQSDNYSVPLVADRSVILLSKPGENLRYEKRFIMDENIKMPVKRGSKLGQVQLFDLDKEKVIGYANLMAETSANRKSFGTSLLGRFISNKN